MGVILISSVHLCKRLEHGSTECPDWLSELKRESLNSPTKRFAKPLNEVKVNLGHYRNDSLIQKAEIGFSMHTTGNVTFTDVYEMTNTLHEAYN